VFIRSVVHCPDEVGIKALQIFYTNYTHNKIIAIIVFIMVSSIFFCFPTDVLEMIPWDGCEAKQVASAPTTYIFIFFNGNNYDNIMGMLICLEAGRLALVLGLV
jgi:hypothetical protein